MTTPNEKGNFTTSIDFLGLPYFLYVTQQLNLRNASRGNDSAAFYQPWIGIAPCASTFSTDLTSVDNLLLAFLSLILILTLEAICATLIQRCNLNFLTPFTLLLYKLFSVKPSTAPPSRIPPYGFPAQTRRAQSRATTITSSLATFLILTLQISILTLTSRQVLEVSNSKSTFELSQPFIPDWNAAWNHSLMLLNQPCLSVAFTGPISQHTSTITTCLSSTLPPSFEPFVPTSTDTTANITSLLHSYGAEHYITIDDMSAIFSARAMFSLQDLHLRLLRQRSHEYDVDLTMSVMHQQYIAYLFTAYVRDTGDESMDLERLRGLGFENSGAQAGPELVVARTENGSALVRTQSVRYTTIVRGVIPRGLAALRFGQNVFKGGIAVEIVEPGEVDLVVNEGQEELEAVVWWETVRAVNWLSMLIAIGVGGIVLFLVRGVKLGIDEEWTGAGEIATRLAGRGVDDMGETERKIVDYREYFVGAETEGGVVWGVDDFEEYERVGRRWRNER